MGKKNKKGSFKNTWGNLTEIGHLFGLTAVKLGAELKKRGYREESGRPSEESIAKGLAKATPLANGREHFMWHKKLLPEALRAEGLKQVGSPSDKAFKVASKIFDMVSKGEKMERIGEDKMAIFIYDEAQRCLGDLIEETKPEKRVSMALRVVQALRHKKMKAENIRALIEQSGVPWSDIEAVELSHSTPKVDKVENKPRL